MSAFPELLSPLVGHEGPLNEWRTAVADKQLHHAWLLQGPRGIGKATIALRCATELLGVAVAKTREAIPDKDPVALRMASGSHPDFRLVRVPIDDKGKPKTEIPVDHIRNLIHFFELSSGLGSWRVAVIDSLDEMNRNGQNALLKTLEEPPSNCVIFLVCHGQQAVLPTIRSRCRLLKFNSLSETEAQTVLQQNGLSATDISTVQSLAPGRPGEAQHFLDSDAQKAAQLAASALTNSAQNRPNDLKQFLAAGSRSPTAFNVAINAIANELTSQAKREHDPIRAGQSAAASFDVLQLGQEATNLNQDRTQALAHILDRITQTLRSV